MDVETVGKFADDIAGWLTEAEGHFLYNAARKCSGKGVIVEIGSWKGKSTIWLGGGSQAGNRAEVFAIDPHTGSSEHNVDGKTVWTFDEFKRNTQRAGVEGVVTPLVTTSADAAKDWKKPVELLWIDGDHEYDMVLLDYQVWEPFLVEGGVIVFHDSNWDGPQKVLRELLFNGDKFKDVNCVDGTTCGTKIKKASVLDVARNKYVGLLQRLYYATAALKMPPLVRAVVKRVGKSFVCVAN